MVQIYRSKWERGFFSSLIGYLRDVIVLSLPIKRLPRFLRKIFYGLDAQFAFLVHPRAYQDVTISAPFLKPMKLFLRKQNAFQFYSRMLPFVLNTVRTKQGVDGLVIAQLTVPDIMFQKRNETLEMLEKSLRLISKIARPGAVVGLGGWFPMVSRRGASLEKSANALGLTVTSGHCGTLVSIYMTVEEISKRGGIHFDQLILAIIGVGKMGKNVARAFNNKVKRLILIDINEVGLRKVKEELVLGNSRTKIDVVLSDMENPSAIRDALRQSHIGVCATSTFRNLLKLRDLPVGFIAIDDSRPEALPRDPKNERIVLEGGLLKIKGAKIDYNYGFGNDDNVFGCLAEAFLLALDEKKSLKPTLGDVDMDNLHNVLDFAKANGVTQGDLKSSDSLISDVDIREALEKRGLNLSSPRETKLPYESSAD